MTGAEIAELLEMPLSTVGAILNRIGLARLSRLEPQEPANRYQRGAAGLARPRFDAAAVAHAAHTETPRSARGPQ
jgi:hypothetical protein